MTRQAAPIGLYDSGLGGLSVARQVVRQLPCEPILYLGDTARLPYGGRTVEELITFNREILAYLASEGAKAIMVACNTSCATALEPLRAESPVPLIGLIDAGARAAAKVEGAVAVLATQATIRSEAYNRALLAHNPDLEILPLACPDLVPIVERGLWESPEALDVVRRQLEPLAGKKLAAAILGCTHFPLLDRAIADVLGPDVLLVDPAAEAVSELTCVLAGSGDLAIAPTSPDLTAHRFVVTGDPERFGLQAERIMGAELQPIGKVFLETLRMAGDRLLQASPATLPAA